MSEIISLPLFQHQVLSLVFILEFILEWIQNFHFREDSDLSLQFQLVFLKWLMFNIYSGAYLMSVYPTQSNVCVWVLPIFQLDNLFFNARFSRFEKYYLDTSPLLNMSFEIIFNQGFFLFLCILIRYSCYRLCQLDACPRIGAQSLTE